MQKEKAICMGEKFHAGAEIYRLGTKGGVEIYEKLPIDTESKLHYNSCIKFIAV